jgi:hypothetical protein
MGRADLKANDCFVGQKIERVYSQLNLMVRMKLVVSPNHIGES